VPNTFRFEENKKNLITRTCTQDDRAFLLSVYEQTIFHQVREYYTVDLSMFHKRFDSDYHEIHIIEQNLTPAGFYQVAECHKMVYVKRFFLHPDFHKKGIGKKLMEEIISWSIQRGKNKIQLMVWENNPALNFYKHLGFLEEKKEGHKSLMCLPLSAF
jgi:GNAT superfamily N-acetyltransferase